MKNLKDYFKEIGVFKLLKIDENASYPSNLFLNERFDEKLLVEAFLYMPKIFDGVSFFTVCAIEENFVSVARTTVESILANSNIKDEEVIEFIDEVVDECLYWSERTTLFLYEIMPILRSTNRKSVREKTFEWGKTLDENYSGEFVDCVEFLSENETFTVDDIDGLIERRNEEIYGRRKVLDEDRDKIFSVCQVALSGEIDSFYYYFTGDLELELGQEVLVPFGQKNVDRKATVVFVGKCYGKALPCKVEQIKFIKKRL